MAGAWSEERRERARQLAKTNKPWLQSTGPRTLEGKRRAARNRYRGALRPARRELRRELKLLMGAVLSLTPGVVSERAELELQSTNASRLPPTGARRRVQAFEIPLGLVDKQVAREIVGALPCLSSERTEARQHD